MIRSFGKSLALCAALTGAAALLQVAHAQTTPAPAASPAAAAPAAAAAAPAGDAAAPAPKPKRKIVKKAASGAVTVKNNRTAALTELNATAEGGGDPVKILGALAAGKQATAHFPRGKDGKSCVFDLQGAYDDGSTTDSPGVDLCKDKKLNLVD